MKLIAILIGAAIGAGLKPLSDLLSKKLLSKRGKEFKNDKKQFIIQLILSACLGGAIGYKTGFTLYSIFLLSVLFTGNVVSTTDLQYRLIPNDMILSIVGIKLVFGILSLLNVGGLPKWNPLMSLAGLAVLAFIFFTPALTGGKIGFGDIKLAMAIGFCSELMPGLMAIAMMGFLVIGYGIMQNQYRFGEFIKSTFPMGPFLCAAQIVSLVLYTV